MMDYLHEKMESLFEVKQTEYTGKRILFTFVLIVLMAASLPLYFRYENHAHDRYTQDYERVKEWVVAYEMEHGDYPLGERVVLEDEKHLMAFFQQNHLNPDRNLFYVSDEKLPQLNELKRTYILDADFGILYTAEYIIYDMRRMHLPGH